MTFTFIETVSTFCFDSKNWLESLSLSGDVQLPNNITGEDLAYIVYSSGTTGKPKGY